jgi:hypothetical protein
MEESHEQYKRRSLSDKNIVSNFWKYKVTVLLNVKFTLSFFFGISFDKIYYVAKINNTSYNLLHFNVVPQRVCKRFFLPRKI